MTTFEERLKAQLRTLPAKPLDDARQADKKRYSELLSQALAVAFAHELRERGLKETRPAGRGELDAGSGAERRMAGGIGAKKVDVTWATEESGLLFAISIKTINFRDGKTKNFQKNLTNRRSDMLLEAVTLHRRFPYAVLAAFFFFDQGAKDDHVREGATGNARRKSTFLNAHARCRLFTGRSDPAGRDEQFEKFYILLVGASPENATVKAYEVGKPDEDIGFDQIFDDLLNLIAERNPDFYEFEDGKIKPVPG